MTPKKRQQKRTDPTSDLLRDLLIVELAKAGIPQPKIREIIGCDMHIVSRIARHFKKAKQKVG